MKASEYKKLLTKAIDDSIEKRWEPLKDDVDRDDVPHNHLCMLDCLYFNNNCYCPLNIGTDNGICCVEHLIWDKTENAQAMIDKIKAIDVDPWTEELVKRGVIEND